MLDEDDPRLGTIALLSPGFYAAMMRQKQDHDKWVFEQMVKNGDAQPWDEDRTRHHKLLLLDHTTWKPTKLFDCPTNKTSPGQKMRLGRNCVFSPDGRWMYMNQLLPRGTWLKLAQGNRRGKVAFTGDVVIPHLSELKPGNDTPSTWMSETPSELMSQRSGIQKATGRVVIGGLGLGWFLNKVCTKKSVTEVIVVEREKVLAEWLWPVLTKLYPAVAAKACWVPADIYQFMAEDKAYWADTRYLLDIWETYPGCDMKFYEFKKVVPNLWGWGDTAEKLVPCFASI